METAIPPAPVSLIAGLLVASPDLLAEVHAELSAAFGAIRLASDAWRWTATNYYAAEMGDDIWRQFVAFTRPVDPGSLAAIKLRTNAMEQRWRTARGRQVNIDPGYVAPLKLVLATTKDAAHRVYLADGIHAEVTLVYERGTFRARAHTYPDYAAPEATAFFNRVRSLSREC